MSDFRMMPAQGPLPESSCGRYGFPIFGHPLQDPAIGYYIASWETEAKARAAAYCLGYPASVVVPISYFVPGSHPAIWLTDLANPPLSD